MNKKEQEERILIILDLDETLIHATEENLGRPNDFSLFGYNVYKRPYLEEFLSLVNRHFSLSIWSSASDDYVEKVVAEIIPDEIDLKFVWGMSRCTYKRNYIVDEFGYYNDNPYSHYHYVKPLKKVKRRGYDLNRVLIIDDTPHKAKENYGNAIYPKEYLGDLEDDELKLLGKYLLTLKDQTNLRKIEKRNWRLKI